MSRSKVTIEEIEKVFDERLATLEIKITETLNKHFDENYAANIAINTCNITKLEERLLKLELAATLKDQEIQALQDENKTLKNDMDDQINRGMRNNLIIKGIPETDGDDRENTRRLVSKELSAIIDEYSEQDVDNVIDRAHRGGRRHQTARGPRHIYIKFLSSSHVDEFVEAGRRQRTTFRLEKQYSKAVTDRRNLAMIERKKLKANKEIISGYVDYPAKLMIKTVGQTTYKLHQEF